MSNIKAHGESSSTPLRKSHNKGISFNRKKIPGSNRVATNAQKDTNTKKSGKRTNHGKTNNILKNEKVSAENVHKREKEVNQCLHILSNTYFKLFKRGQYVTSYRFVDDFKLLGVARCKLFINVPHDYPNSAMKLHYKMLDSKNAATSDEKLDILVKNFNVKVRQMVLEEEPLISQLNYLVHKADVLSRPDFKLIDKREQEFYSKFI